jgi:hypothetical protein
MKAVCFFEIRNTHPSECSSELKTLAIYSCGTLVFTPWKWRRFHYPKIIDQVDISTLEMDSVCSSEKVIHQSNRLSFWYEEWGRKFPRNLWSMHQIIYFSPEDGGGSFLLKAAFISHHISALKMVAVRSCCVVHCNRERTTCDVCGFVVAAVQSTAVTRSSLDQRH